ncbi:MAG: hypothetical protein KatS3mg081_1475 [Gemmatimonadales bacterium]|nr:hypothetical protein HRbin33_00692 [bacterium HR33]GIW52120.1 MAG: hypothetical protein KatS3mg081_1475 [Gemmatimonadales bacterium]
MNLPSPPDPRLDRAAIERIIQRAAELQAAEKDLSEGLSEEDLIALGKEVGIPERYLRQALLEERSRADFSAGRGWLSGLLGPHRVAAGRAIARERAEVERDLHRWMSEGELLQVKRRFGRQVTWEAQQGAFATLRRAFRAGGRRYTLARAREVSGQVVELEAGRCFVQLSVDLSHNVVQYLAGALVLLGAGALFSAVGMALGVLLPVAIAPALIAVPAAWAVARSRRRKVEEFQLAAEQVLDRLEHGELELHRPVREPSLGPIARVAEELRRSLGV